MDKQYKFKEGDIVDVSRDSELLYAKAEILYMPCASGDSWIFKDRFGGIHYVSEGITVSKQL